MKVKGNKNVSHLICIRHGESVWNSLGLWTGWQDIPLSKKGETEAKTAANLIKDFRLDIAFTSDLKRAYETLEIIKKELKIINLPTVKDAAFKERHYGIYTGKNKWDVQKSIGEENFLKLRRGWDTPIPDGETLKDVYDRVIPQYQKLILREIEKGANILFVTHGNTNRALIKYIEKIPDQLISDVEMTTGEVIVYQLDLSGNFIKKEKRSAKHNN